MTSLKTHTLGGKLIWFAGLSLAFSLGCSKVGFSPSPVEITQSSPDPGQPELRFPKVGGDVAAVAFEDNFPKPGDADYNDFLVNFRMIEKINDQDQVTDIIVDFYPRTLGGSYDHSLLVVLNGQKSQPSNITLKTTPLFNGDAMVRLTHYDAGGAVLDTQNGLPVDQDVTVFASTHAAFNAQTSTQIINTFATQSYVPAVQSARLEIHLANPALNPVGAKAEIDISKLRMVLHVKNTGKDIDTVDVDPLNVDSNGYPFGFIIPSNWQWPQEGISIASQYPNFAQYQLYLLQKMVLPDVVAPQQVLNWFNYLSATTGLYPQVPLPRLLPEP
jgi:LruC domain-containing protein